MISAKFVDAKSRLVGIAYLDFLPEGGTYVTFADGGKYRVEVCELHISRPVITTELAGSQNYEKALDLHRSNTTVEATIHLKY